MTCRVASDALKCQVEREGLKMAIWDSTHFSYFNSIPLQRLCGSVSGRFSPCGRRNTWHRSKTNPIAGRKWHAYSAPRAMYCVEFLPDTVYSIVTAETTRSCCTDSNWCTLWKLDEHAYPCVHNWSPGQRSKFRVIMIYLPSTLWHFDKTLCVLSTYLSLPIKSSNFSKLDCVLITLTRVSSCIRIEGVG